MSMSTTYTCDRCEKQLVLGPGERLKADHWFVKEDCALCTECRKHLLTTVDEQVRKLVEAERKLFPEGDVQAYRGAAWLYSELAIEICKPRNALHPDGACAEIETPRWVDPFKREMVEGVVFPPCTDDESQKQRVDIVVDIAHLKATSAKLGEGIAAKILGESIISAMMRTPEKK